MVMNNLSLLVRNYHNNFAKSCRALMLVDVSCNPNTVVQKMKRNVFENFI